MKELTRDRLIEILRSFEKLSIGVVGDFALDAYWYADMTRSEISRETPRFIRPIIRETYSPGGAANVANNVTALGVGQVFAFTVLGKDWRGEILRTELEKQGVNLKYSIASPERVTTTYVKPILLGYGNVQQEDDRIDFINKDVLSESLEKQLITNIEGFVEYLDVLLIADYLERGIITDNVRTVLNYLAETHPKKIFVADSRNRIGLYRNMTLKPNEVEAIQAIYPNRDPREFDFEELEKIGIELQRRALRPICITIGEKGALLFTDNEYIHLPAVPTKPPIDPVGAGDTFLSALGISLGVRASPWEAVYIANLAAGVVIKKLNITGTASFDEILAKFDEVKQIEKEGTHL